MANTGYDFTLKDSANALDPSFSNRPRPEKNTFSASGDPASTLFL